MMWVMLCNKECNVDFVFMRIVFWNEFQYRRLIEYGMCGDYVSVMIDCKEI